jgi:hypothetical protein
MFYFACVSMSNFLTVISSYSLSGSFSADKITPNLFTLSTSSAQQQRSVGGSSTLFHGIMMNLNGIFVI